MNIAYLKTLLTIHASGSFLDASGIMNLSHSAVSTQMKRLEERLQRDLFKKGTRPAQLTAFGIRFCNMASAVVADYDRLMRSADRDSVEGPVRIGFVSTTLQTLLPIVLETLRHSFPLLSVNAVSGLSDELAAQVDAGELDFAFVSASSEIVSNVQMIEIAREPLRIIAAKSTSPPENPLDVLTDQPFIGFARNTWLGSQIFTALRDSKVPVNQVVELDSIDAIEHLVSLGAGVSVVPQRLFAQDLGERMQSLDFPVRNNFRVLNLVTQRDCDRETVLRKLTAIADSKYGTV